MAVAVAVAVAVAAAVVAYANALLCMRHYCCRLLVAQPLAVSFSVMGFFMVPMLPLVLENAAE